MVKVVFHIECETAPGEVIAPGTFEELRGALFSPSQRPLLPPAAPPPNVRALPSSTGAVAVLPPSLSAQPLAPALTQPIEQATKQEAIEDRRSAWLAIFIGGCVGLLFLFLLIRHGPRVIPFMRKTSDSAVVEPTTTESESSESTAPDGETVILDSPNPAAGTHPEFPNTTPESALGDN